MHAKNQSTFHLDWIHSPKLCWVARARYHPGTVQFQTGSLSQNMVPDRRTDPEQICQLPYKYKAFGTGSKWIGSRANAAL